MKRKWITFSGFRRRNTHQEKEKFETQKEKKSSQIK